jgi:hypothetical protein
VEPNRPALSGWGDFVKQTGAVAIVNGVTDAANCGARGGNAQQCREAFGGGTANGAIGAVVGTIVLNTATAVGRAAIEHWLAGGFAAVGVGDAVVLGGLVTGGGVIVGTMVAGSIVMGHRLGDALGNLANTARFGTPQQQRQSQANLGQLDRYIAELNDLSRTGAGSLAAPLAQAKALRGQLAGLRAEPGSTPPRQATPADDAAAAKKFGEACVAADTALENLTARVEDAEARSTRAAQLLRAPDVLDNSPASTAAAARAAREALDSIADAATLVQRAAAALQDVRAGAAQTGGDTVARWRQQIAAFTEAVDRLEDAVSAAGERRTRFDQLQREAGAAAQLMRPAMNPTDLPALDRRVELIRNSTFTPTLEEAVAIVRAATGEIAATRRLLEQQAADAAKAAAEGDGSCAHFVGQPGWRAAAQRIRDSDAKRLQTSVASISQALLARDTRLQQVERANVQTIREAPQRQAAATAAGNTTLARQIAEALTRSRARAVQSLQPQRQTLTALALEHMNADSAVRNAAAAISSVQ